MLVIILQVLIPTHLKARLNHRLIAILLPCLIQEVPNIKQAILPNQVQFLVEYLVVDDLGLLYQRTYREVYLVQLVGCALLRLVLDQAIAAVHFEGVPLVL